MSGTLKINGRTVPHGTIAVSGAKNSATRLLAASVLSEQPVTLVNFPTELVDVREKVRFLRDCSVDVELDPDRDSINVVAAAYTAQSLSDYDYRFRTTYLLVAGQLLRSERAVIPYPGGCNLGDRKHDLHIMVWEKLGAQVQELDEFIQIDCSRLTGAEIAFPISTVGGTENALLCAAIAEGETVIRNAYITPEVADLIAFLKNMGAEIEVFGRSMIKIQGHPEGLGGTHYSVMPDRIEAVTWMIYAALSEGELLIRNVPLGELEAPMMYLNNAGVDCFVNQRDVFVSPACVGSYGLQPFEVPCGTHPGVHSDMQPFFSLLAMKAHGRSLVVDYRYPKRIAYLEQLQRFCSDPAALEWTEGCVVVKGPVDLVAAQADSTDLRGSMAVILAALLAEGESTIHNPEMAMRGYNRLVEKLQSIGIECEYHAG